MDRKEKLQAKFDAVHMCLKIKGRTITDFRMSLYEFLSQQRDDYVYHKGELENGPKQEMEHNIKISVINFSGLNSEFNGHKFIFDLKIVQDKIVKQIFVALQKQ